MVILHKKIIRFMNLFALLGVLVVLPHCARYQPSALLRPHSRIEKSGIEVGLKALAPSEFRRYFDSSLATKNFIPLQLYIKNRTSTTYILDPDNISLPIESSKAIARQLYRNTILRVMIWAIPGQLFWPCNIPAIIDGVYSSEANKAIDDDLQDRGFSGSYVEIKPRTSFNRIFFVHKTHYRPEVSIRLEDFDNQAPLEFNFDLREGGAPSTKNVVENHPIIEVPASKEPTKRYWFFQNWFTSTSKN